MYLICILFIIYLYYFRKSSKKIKIKKEHRNKKNIGTKRNKDGNSKNPSLVKGMG